MNRVNIFLGNFVLGYTKVNFKVKDKVIHAFWQIGSIFNASIKPDTVSEIGNPYLVKSFHPE